MKLILTTNPFRRTFKVGSIEDQKRSCSTNTGIIDNYIAESANLDKSLIGQPATIFIISIE